jgi:hypothetical protein
VSGALRWVTWGDGGAWHLRFGMDGPMLCDQYPGVRPRTRFLGAGAPAKRCPDCATVIVFRLGLGDTGWRRP